MGEVKKQLHWQGFSTPVYAVLLAIALTGSYMGIAQKGFLGTLTYCLLVGIFFTKIGDSIPFIKKYFGGGSIVNLFAVSALVYAGWIPETTVAAVKELGNSMDLFGFVCMALIMGSILGMDRKLLIKAGSRFAVPILGCVLFGGLFTMAGGLIMGYGAWPALFKIGFPVFGAGAASGAVPISQIYESLTGTDAGTFLSQLMPAVALGNAVAIVMAGLMNGLGKRFPSLTGNGSVMKDYEPQTPKRKAADARSMGRGLIITGTFMTAGIILSKFVPIHYYATTIIICGIAKIFNLLQEEMMEDCRQWFDFVSGNCVPAIIAVTGIAAMDLGLVIEAMSIQYVVLIVLCVLGCAVGAGFFGKLAGFYPIEAGITGGLCMANMGGSGDIATLAAADRMELMQFAQISSRLGGAFIIILVNVVASLVGVAW